MLRVDHNLDETGTHWGNCILLLFILYAYLLAGCSTTNDFPIICYENGTVRIENLDVSISDFAVIAANGCKIVISNSNIRAKGIVVGENHVDISIKNSKLESQQETLLLRDFGVIVIDKGYISSSSKTSITSKNGLKLSISNSNISGLSNGITSENRGNIFIKNDSGIYGNIHAIKVGTGNKIKIDNSLVSSDQTAIDLGPFGEVEIRKSRISGQIGIFSKWSIFIDMISGQIIGNRIGCEFDYGIVELKSGMIHGLEKGLFAYREIDLNMQGGIISGDTAIYSGKSMNATILNGEIHGDNIGITAKNKLNMDIKNGFVMALTAIETKELIQFKGNENSIRDYKSRIHKTKGWIK